MSSGGAHSLSTSSRRRPGPPRERLRSSRRREVHKRGSARCLSSSRVAATSICGYGSRLGGRDDELCVTRSRTTNLTDSIFKRPNDVIASAAKQSMAQQGSKKDGLLRCARNDVE